VERRIGARAADMLENGEATKPMAGEFCIILTETSTRDNGKMIEQAAKESTLTATALGTQEVGLMTSSTDLAQRLGMTELHIRGNIPTARSTVKAS
jgi:hypothetical protein